MIALSNFNGISSDQVSNNEILIEEMHGQNKDTSRSPKGDMNMSIDQE